MAKRPPKGAWEQDAFTRWRHMFHWQPGALRYIKRQASKRERREGRKQARSDEQ